MRTLPVSVRSVLVVLLAAVLGLALMMAPPRARADPDDSIDGQSCTAQIQALDGVHQRIDQHNSQNNQFTIPDQQAEADAYQADANALRAEQESDVSALDSCQAAIQSLNQAGPIPKPRQSSLNNIQAGKDGIPKGYVVPGVPPLKENGDVQVTPELRPLYEALRALTPSGNFDNSALQGEPKPQIGDPDPSMHPGGGGLIQANPDYPQRPNVQVDHVVPLAEILYIPGFTNLTPEQMYAVVNTRMNLQWLSGPANAAKGSGSVASMVNVDPDWWRDQLKLEAQVLTQLTGLIAQMQQSGAK